MTIDKYISEDKTILYFTNEFEFFLGFPKHMQHMKFREYHDYMKTKIDTKYTIFLFFDVDIKPQPGDIPDFINNLSFGHNFNQKIEHGVIPNSVTSIYFEYNFNQPKEDIILPQSVEIVNIKKIIHEKNTNGDDIYFTDNITFEKGTDKFNNRFTVYNPDNILKIEYNK